VSSQKSFALDVLTLTTVPVISQVMGLLLTPIVTRLFTPEAFGLSNIFGSMVMLFAVFSTMGYHGAIILPKTDTTALKILVICFYFTLCISAISYLIVTAGKYIIPAKLNTPELVEYLWLTPIFVFSHGMFATLRFWKTRFRRFDNIAVSRVSDNVVRKFFQISAGFLGYSTAGSLIFADFTASATRNFILLKNMNLKTISLKNKSYLKLWAVAKRYRKFPLYSLWGEVFARFPAIIISFLIIKYFGQEMLGYYGLSLMVLALPTNLVINSISEAFLPRLAEAKHKGKHVVLIEKVFERIFSFCVFPLLILGIFGDVLFSFMFGQNWEIAGVITQILVFGTFFSIIFSTTYPIITIMERQELIPLNKLINIVNITLSFLIGGYFKNIYLALIIYSVLQSLQVSAMGIFALRIVELKFTDLIKKLIYYVFICISLTSVLIYSKTLANLSMLPLFFVICLCTLIYYSLVLYHDIELRFILSGMLRKLKISRN